MQFSLHIWVIIVYYFTLSSVLSDEVLFIIRRDSSLQHTAVTIINSGVSKVILLEYVGALHLFLLPICLILNHTRDRCGIRIKHHWCLLLLI